MQDTITKLLDAHSDPDPQNWSGHIILCGVNNLALRIFEQLSVVNMRVVIMDDDPEVRLARLLAQQGALVLHEDSRLPEALIRAGIRQAAAIITVEGNDLHNLETVLAANEVVPGIRAVASFFNQQIGKQLVSTVKNARSVSLSEKAGPAFVSAALPSRLLNIFKVKIHRSIETLAVAELVVEKGGILGDLYGNLTPVALHTEPDPHARQDPNVSPDADPTIPHFIPSPSRSTKVRPGDRVTLVGWVEDMKQLASVHLTRTEIEEAEIILEANQDKPVSMRAHRKNGVVRAKNMMGGVFKQMGRPFRFAALAFLALLLIGTLVFELFYRHIDATGKAVDLDWVSSLYFTVTIVSTTGFGDFNLSIQEWPLKVFGIFLMLSGTTIVATMFAFMTNALISLRLDQELGRKMATELENHVIMCGLGTVGYKALKGMLERGQQVVVIERDTNDRFNPEVRALGVPIIRADSRLPESLRAANIEKARCIAIMTSDDLANLETALVARSLKPGMRVVLRLFDRNLAEKVGRNFNIRYALSASAIAAPAFIAEAFNHVQLTTFYIERTPFTAAQETILPGSRLNGMTVGRLQTEFQIQVLSYMHRTQLNLVNANDPFEIQTAESIIEIPDTLEPTMHPAADKVIREGDSIVFIGPYDRVIKLHHLNISEGK